MLGPCNEKIYPFLAYSFLTLQRKRSRENFQKRLPPATLNCPQRPRVCLPYPHLVDVDHIPSPETALPACFCSSLLPHALFQSAAFPILISEQITAPFLHTSFKSDFSSDAPTSRSIQGPLTGHAVKDLHSCPLPLARIHLELRCS